MPIKCPNCHKPSTFDESNPWRPFCCERCKLIDMGDWISEKHSIPGETGLPLDEDEFPPEGLN